MNSLDRGEHVHTATVLADNAIGPDVGHAASVVDRDNDASSVALEMVAEVVGCGEEVVLKLLRLEVLDRLIAVGRLLHEATVQHLAPATPSVVVSATTYQRRVNRCRPDGSHRGSAPHQATHVV